MNADEWAERALNTARMIGMVDASYVQYAEYDNAIRLTVNSDIHTVSCRVNMCRAVFSVLSPRDAGTVSVVGYSFNGQIDPVTAIERVYNIMDRVVSAPIPPGDYHHRHAWFAKVLDATIKELATGIICPEEKTI